ncbi:MAG: hypothetical protein CO186_06130 [Zetaproteobacteria bacterium CG_4_9_14_3_um_filter_49_83]|nr:MAG: hypothetical protein AUJ56_09360 [Zetaproteobacteria bacterium CG1_02_49_23]PIQ30279.1 MAG: hypothetical protein COW62_13005 [Zetaproteobacteria bacterium CG17_big_fil_post_rev_8_21_14_2_50_50_13]PIV29892.1 MAG: hypothetical protein COS35_09605 [Zetaproteobacteria bacterium CG02_land_8_20_14_3_00_50_9]PIY56312.1 MAG: hypothetical protein COZ00_04900 [Zetaproteobacteria bacterium CG_4_10_14_0_8_um_filter_49_80]PJA35396.1 MAG: hypothetical protein CO186_06130 [Zetaproteobacteria bacterium
MRISLFVGLSLIALLSGCANIPHTLSSTQTSSIGPYESFEGRLMVIQPNKRWQVQIQWQGTPDQGRVRLTHAASGRIVYLTWAGDHMSMLDNQTSDPLPRYKSISKSELAQQGLVIRPQQLASILQGKIPASLKQQQTNQWKGSLNHSLIQLEWNPQLKKLSLKDSSHGNIAILLIEHDTSKHTSKHATD